MADCAARLGCGDGSGGGGPLNAALSPPSTPPSTTGGFGGTPSSFANPGGGAGSSAEDASAAAAEDWHLICCCCWIREQYTEERVFVVIDLQVWAARGILLLAGRQGIAVAAAAAAVEVSNWLDHLSNLFMVGVSGISISTRSSHRAENSLRHEEDRWWAGRKGESLVAGVDLLVVRPSLKKSFCDATRPARPFRRCKAQRTAR